MRISPWVLPLLSLLGLLSGAWSQFQLSFGDAGKKIEEAMPGQAPAEPKQPRRLLVFTKTNGYRHGSIPVGRRALELMGEKSGAFETVVSEDLECFERERLAEFDGVCFLNTTLDVFRPRGFETLEGEAREAAMARDTRLKKNLLDFVASGKAFIGIHAASDTFHEWPPYGEMLGGYFDGHPWGASSQVGIRPAGAQGAHPINAAFGGETESFREEIYQFKAPYDSSKLHVLLRLDPEKSDMNRSGIKRQDGDFGVSWIKPYGRGRVFYCSLGHNKHIYWNSRVLGHYLAGIQWALGDLAAPCEPGAGVKNP